MKRLSLFALLALLASPFYAQESGSQEALQRIFDPQATQQQLLENIQAAGKAGVPRQQLIEAKLIWGLRRQDAAWLEKLLPELEVLADNFDPGQSAGFKSARDVRSFLAYTRALQAQLKNDEAGFKQHILEAVWLNPEQAELFTQTIVKQRREAKMASLKIDLGLALVSYDGSATTLADQLAGKKALLLDFWASWCGPCMQLMPALKKKAEELAPHGIVVVGMNKDDEKPQDAASQVREQQGIQFPWLLEPEDRPLSKLLEIDSIPRMILVDAQGRVLYNGHPQDPALWEALKKIDPTIQAPGA